MKVILAGMSKTGTKSMAVALRELGYDVYDYLENYMYLGKDWEKIFRDGGSTEDFRRMYEDVDAVVDAPAFAYWDEILKAFPDAKVNINIVFKCGLAVSMFVANDYTMRAYERLVQEVHISRA